MTIYLSGVSHQILIDANHDDLGLLATPASAVYRKRGEYQHWAADNGLFVAPLPDGTEWPGEILGCPATTATARAVRYGPEPELVTRWLRWLNEIGPDGCLFATLPDVVGDYAATWERSAQYVAKVRALGFPVATVMQDGLEHDRFVWGSMLNASDAVFIGGSTEWKLGAACAELVAEAKAAGKWVHMGRVNSYKRLAYARSIGCDSADGTYVKFGPAVNAPKVLGWLDKQAAANEEAIAA